MKNLILVLFILVMVSIFNQTFAQSMVFTTKTFAATTGGPGGSFEPEELLVVDSQSSDARHLVPQTALHTFLGDADGDFSLADFNKNIDAIAVAQSPSPNNVLGLLLSVDQTMKILGGTVKDGDIFAIETQGQVNVVYPESLFANATQTSTIDVDAFHEAADGSLYFSFATDEVSTEPGLIASNSGNPIFDESVVFVLPAGSTTAQMLYSRADILLFVNNALGTNFTTVVDLTGFTPDPNSPGDWIFAVASTNSLIEGKLFSTALNGSLANMAGSPIDSGSLGFVDKEVLEGIAFKTSDSLVFRLFSPITVPSPAGFHSYAVSGATPFQSVQLFASNSIFPGPLSLPISSMNGFPYVYVNVSDPLFAISVTSLDFSRYADFEGNVIIPFPTANLPVGLRITMQAVDVVSGTVSMPASAGI